MSIRYKNLTGWIGVFVFSLVLYGQTIFEKPIGFDSLESQINSSISFLTPLTQFGEFSIVNSLLRIILLGLISSLIFSISSQFLRHNRWFSAFAAASIFVVHPIHTELVGSPFFGVELISLFMALLAWLAILQGSKTKLNLWSGLAAILLLVSIVIYPEVAPLALVIPLSLWFLKIGSHRYQLTTLTVLVSLTFLLFTLSSASLLPFGINTYQASSTNWSAGQIIIGLSQYIKLSFWPYPQSFYYGFNAIPFNGWSSSSTIFSIASILAVFSVGLVLFFRKKLAGFGLILFIVCLLPVSNLLYPLEAVIVERGLLIPSIGISLFMSALLNWLYQHVNRYVSVGLLITVLVSFSFLSHSRLAQWKDYETLMQHDVSNYPGSSELLRYNGEYYFERIPYFEGEERHLIAKKTIGYLLLSSRLSPNKEKAHFQLGILYNREINQPFEAIPHFERNLKLQPNNFLSSFNLAGCYSQIGMQDSAIYFIKKTLDINPSHYESLEFLTSHYFRSGNVGLGFGFANKFIHTYPDSDVPHLIFADYYFKQDNELIAIQQLEIAAQKNPTNKETLKVLFDYYYAKNDFDKAERYRDIAVYN